MEPPANPGRFTLRNPRRREPFAIYLKIVSSYLSWMGKRFDVPSLLDAALSMRERRAGLFAGHIRWAHWRQAQQDLATSLIEAGERREKMELIDQGIALRAAVVDCFSAEENPNDWAAAKLNLALAYETLDQVTHGARGFCGALAAAVDAWNVLDSTESPMLAKASDMGEHFLRMLFVRTAFNPEERRKCFESLGSSLDVFRSRATRGPYLAPSS
jgi:hypothetical protein